MGDTQRSRDIARAALLRERIISALQAAPEPMTTNELASMSGLIELYHKSLLPQKISVQLSNLVKAGAVVRLSKGQYAAAKERRQPQQEAAAEEAKHLRLEVSKSEHTISFLFEGLQISIKVLP